MDSTMNLLESSRSSLEYPTNFPLKIESLQSPTDNHSTIQPRRPTSHQIDFLIQFSLLPLTKPMKNSKKGLDSHIRHLRDVGRIARVDTDPSLCMSNPLRHDPNASRPLATIDRLHD
jgi:hypothetical protein